MLYHARDKTGVAVSHGYGRTVFISEEYVQATLQDFVFRRRGKSKVGIRIIGRVQISVMRERQRRFARRLYPDRIIQCAFVLSQYLDHVGRGADKFGSEGIDAGRHG